MSRRPSPNATSAAPVHKIGGVGLPARRAAFDLIEAVLTDGRPLDEALSRIRSYGGLAGSDRAHARLMASTVLRRLGQIDAVLSPFLKRPPKGKGLRTLSILRLGAAQILFLETPPHAAVATAVELAGAVRLQPFKGLVNAVLRKVAEVGPAAAAQQDVARLNTPDWLWTSWSEAYGTTAARDVAEAHLLEAPLDLTVKQDPAVWAERLGGVVLPTGTVRLGAVEELRRLPGFAAGDWWVQDAAAALPARLLGDVAGRTVVDLCAAPGGKTAQLALAGARVTAVDRSEARIAVLRDNLARLNLEAETVVADARAWRPAAPVDAVLLDAPCSGTGTLRRHPDIARLRTAEDAAVLADLQVDLLKLASTMLRPGGVLVYATCSLQPEEGPGAVDRAIAEGAPLEPDPIAAGELAGLPQALTAEGRLRSLPSFWAERGGMDGFFAARLIKTAA